MNYDAHTDWRFAYKIKLLPGQLKPTLAILQQCAPTAKPSM